MGKPALQTIVLPFVIIIAGCLAVIALTGFVQRSRPPLPDSVTDADLSLNGSRLKGFAFGMEGLLADWYWTRSLQYVGDKMISHKDENINMEDLRSLNPRLLYPYLQNATDLDPHFIAAYSYGAMVLPAIDPQKAVDLTSRGIVNNPTAWRLYQHLGYIYWRLGQYDKAAECYDLGSQVDGAQPFMKLMAASMRTHGGSRETARKIYEQMLTESDDEQVRITAKRRLQEIDSLDERDAIDKALGEFKEKNGRCAANFSEILGMLISVDLPSDNEFNIDRSNRLVDPSGAPYLLDKENCRSKLDPGKTGIAVQ